MRSTALVILDASSSRLDRLREITVAAARWTWLAIWSGATTHPIHDAVRQRESRAALYVNGRKLANVTDVAIREVEP